MGTGLIRDPFLKNWIPASAGMTDQQIPTHRIHEGKLRRNDKSSSLTIIRDRARNDSRKNVQNGKTMKNLASRKFWNIKNILKRSSAQVHSDAIQESLIAIQRNGIEVRSY